MPKEKNLSTNELAHLINKGFDGMQSKFDGMQNSMDENFGKVNGRLNDLERAMEEIKLKFAYTAWAIDVEELKLRVETIEKKLKIKSL